MNTLYTDSSQANTSFVNVLKAQQQVSGKIRINWSGYTASAIQKQEVYYSKDGGTYILLDTITGGNVQNILFDTAKYPNGVYKFWIKITENTGNIIHTYSTNYLVQNISTQTSTTTAVPVVKSSASTTSVATVNSVSTTKTVTQTSVPTTQATTTAITTTPITASITTQNVTTQAISDVTNSATTVSNSASTTIASISGNIDIGGRSISPQIAGILAGICCLALLILIGPWFIISLLERRKREKELDSASEDFDIDSNEVDDNNTQNVVENTISPDDLEMYGYKSEAVPISKNVSKPVVTQSNVADDEYVFREIK